MSFLCTQGLSAAYDGRIVLSDINVEFLKGKTTALIGANGSGKSTLLKNLARLLNPLKGQVLLEGQSIHTLNTKTLAQQMSILPQGPKSPSDISVRELVTYGRYPFLSWMQRPGTEDVKIVEWALEQTRMTELQDRPVDNLSGGERQRAWIALALAQQPRLLLLDEPTTFLDICHQLEVLELLKRLNHDLGITVIMALHDLNQAARYSQHVVALQQGKLAACGTPTEIFTEKLLQSVFSIDAEVFWDTRFNAPQCIPILPLAKAGN